MLFQVSDSKKEKNCINVLSPYDQHIRQAKAIENTNELADRKTDRTADRVFSSFSSRQQTRTDRSKKKTTAKRTSEAEHEHDAPAILSLSLSTVFLVRAPLLSAPQLRRIRMPSALSRVSRGWTDRQTERREGERLSAFPSIPPVWRVNQPSSSSFSSKSFSSPSRDHMLLRGRETKTVSERERERPENVTQMRDTGTRAIPVLRLLLPQYLLANSAAV